VLARAGIERRFWNGHRKEDERRVSFSSASEPGRDRPPSPFILAAIIFLPHLIERQRRFPCFVTAANFSAWQFLFLHFSPLSSRLHRKLTSTARRQSWEKFPSPRPANLRCRRISIAPWPCSIPSPTCPRMARLVKSRRRILRAPWRTGAWPWPIFTSSGSRRFRPRRARHGLPRSTQLPKP